MNPSNFTSVQRRQDSPKLAGSGLARRFAGDERGSFAVLGALSLGVLVMAVGAGIDLSRAEIMRKKMANAVALTCQKISAMDVSNLNDVDRGQVDTFLKANLSAQGLDPAAMRSGASISARGPSDVATNATMDTMFMGAFGASTMQISADLRCFNTPPTPPGGNAANSYVLRENFETNHVTENNGSWTVTPDYNGWTTTGRGVERQNASLARPPEGSWAAELDSHSNTSMSKKVRLEAGTYELRYWYSARIGYTDLNSAYDPVPVCSPNSHDLGWMATDRQTNRIAASLSPDTDGWQPRQMGIDPTDPSWLPENLVDVCGYSNGWIERSLTIIVPTSGDYWVTMAAQGASDSLGGLIDDIRLCRRACPGQPVASERWRKPGEHLFQEQFRNWSVGYSRDLASNGWTGLWGHAEIWNRSSAPAEVVRQWEPDDDRNQMLTRRFLLPPGSYEIAWRYRARIIWAAGSGPIGTICAAQGGTLAAGLMPSGSAVPVRGDWQNNVSRSYDTNRIGLYMDNGHVATTRPVTAVDACGNATDEAYVLRLRRISVTQPTWYWMSFRGEGASDSVGGFVGDIRLCAVSCGLGDPSATIAMAHQPRASVSRWQVTDNQSPGT